MVFLKRSAPPKPGKRPASSIEPRSQVPTAAASTSAPTVAAFTTAPAATFAPAPSTSASKSLAAADRHHIGTMISLLADAGCTLRSSPDGPPSLPADPHRLRRHLESRLSADPALLSYFLSGLSSYIQSPQNLHKILIPASRDGVSSSSDSLARILLLIPPIQPQIQLLLLEKLPEHFTSTAPSLSLREDVARLIIGQFRWLDFLADSEGFTEKLMEVLSIAPLSLKKEIIGSLPEIIGDQSHGKVVAALERLLQEDSEVIVPVLESFSNLNLDDQLQEQVVTIALSCIRTIDGEHMPHLLRFLLLSATPANAGRIISKIREQLKFVGATDSRDSRQRKLKGKSQADSTEASVLEALRSSLRFKNILCEAIMKEIKSLNQRRDHKVIDVWLLMLMHTNGGSLQKSVEKILKKKIIDGCFCESVFDQCIHGHRELVKDYFTSFLSVCEYLLACKEHQVRQFGIHLYISLFEEFNDTYSRQEVLGALVTHIGSGIGFEVSSALDTMVLLASQYSEELITVSSHINGILDYLEGFHEDDLHKVYEVFCHLALSARSSADSIGSSIGNELLMIIRKQVSNSDMKYRKMGIIGTLKIVSTLGNASAATVFSSSQKTNGEEALELLKMSIDSCKLVTLPLILLYDELIALLECNTLQPAIVEWIGKHTGEFEPIFLADLEGGQLIQKESSNDMEGEIWMNLDGDRSPICVNILPLLSSSSQQCSTSLHILSSQFLLLSVVERLNSQGSLEGIDALLGCPLHLPSLKYLVGSHWKKLTAIHKQIVCFSLYFAINWIRELLNAFSTQVTGKMDCITQATREETIAKLMKRLRNLVLLESLLNSFLKVYSISLPELRYSTEYTGSPFANHPIHKKHREKRSAEKTMSQGTSQSKKKHRKDSQPDPKQPSILDALKKAGVVVNQEPLNESSSRNSLDGKASISIEHQDIDSNELGLVDISAEVKVLDAQRSKFRPLLVDCLSILSFSQTSESCCSDPAAELPMHLYLLRDFRNKLEYLNPPSKHPFASSPKAPPGYCRMTTSEFLNKIRPLFTSLKKHLEASLSILTDGNDTCEDHWRSYSSAAGNPDIPSMTVSESSVASSVIREVLYCYSKTLSLPELFLQKELSILRDLLEAFQSIEKPGEFFSELQPLPTPGDIDYLHCGVYFFLEGVFNKACLFSFFLASEVLVTLQSLVNSIAILFDKSTEGNGKNMHGRGFQRVYPFLKRKLGLSAHKMLVHDWSNEENENGLKNKGEIIQKILQIYLKNSESTSDLLDEIACTILPQVPSSRTKNTQEASHNFPTLCPTMFLTWYRVLHEENLVNLNKLVKEVILKSRAGTQREIVIGVLSKLRQSVNVVVSLVNMCKVHDKVNVHAMAVKYGGKFVDTFLKAFDFLQAHFQEHHEIIIQTVKELQKATRIIQTLCSEAKGLKRTMITSKIPATKRSMERFLFHVKALLHNTSSGCTFWMGNLKHKDLYGQVVSSQVYGDADDPDEEAAEEEEDDDDRN